MTTTARDSAAEQRLLHLPWTGEPGPFACALVRGVPASPVCAPRRARSPRNRRADTPTRRSRLGGPFPALLPLRGRPPAPSARRCRRGDFAVPDPKSTTVTGSTFRWWTERPRPDAPRTSASLPARTSCCGWRSATPPSRRLPMRRGRCGSPDARRRDAFLLRASPEDREVSLQQQELSIAKHEQREDPEAVGAMLEEYDPYRHVVYRCVLDSHSYGLAAKRSDTDRRRIYLLSAQLHCRQRAPSSSDSQIQLVVGSTTTR